MTDGSKPTLEAAANLEGRALDGRYRVVRRLGAGGMGAVYEGEHVALGTRVAIKVLQSNLAAHEKYRQRFLREARAASAIRSDNVVQISDFGMTSDGIVYIVMEFLEGRDLEQVLRSTGPMPWARAHGLLCKVLGALRAAHAKNIIHRDIKAANCFVFDNPDKGIVDDLKVLDFGLAKVTVEDDPAARGLTGTGELFGTVSYMAPELVQNKPASARTDLYAVGVLMYRTLVGELPFQAPNAYLVLTQQINELPPHPLEKNPNIPEAAAMVILRALAKDPNDRFASADEMLSALLAIPAHARGEGQTTIAPAPASPAGRAATGRGGGRPVGRAPVGRPAAPPLRPPAVKRVVPASPPGVAPSPAPAIGSPAHPVPSPPLPVAESAAPAAAAVSPVIASSSGASVSATPGPTVTAPALDAPGASTPAASGQRWPQPTGSQSAVPASTGPNATVPDASASASNSVASTSSSGELGDTAVALGSGLGPDPLQTTPSMEIDTRKGPPLRGIAVGLGAAALLAGVALAGVIWIRGDSTPTPQSARSEAIAQAADPSTPDEPESSPLADPAAGEESPEASELAATTMDAAGSGSMEVADDEGLDVAEVVPDDDSDEIELLPPDEPETTPEPSEPSRPAASSKDKAKPKPKPLTDSRTQRTITRKAKSKCAGAGPVKVTAHVKSTGEASSLSSVSGGTSDGRACVKALVLAAKFPAGSSRMVKFSLTL